MLGQAPRIPAEVMALTLNQERGLYELMLMSGAVTQTLWVNPKNHRVVESQVRGVNAYDLKFDDFETVGQAIYPRKVRLTAEAAKTKLELLYKDVEINPAPDLTMFEMEAPANVPVVEVDEAGNAK
jgi:hypothetical protein